MDTTTILILALRALLETLSLAESQILTLGEDTDSAPVGYLNDLLAGLGAEERVSGETTLTQAWLILDGVLERQTALRVHSPLAL